MYCERHRSIHQPDLPRIPISDEYRVTRRDGKWPGAIVFVLDPARDPHALAALKVYQESLYRENHSSMDAHTLGVFVEMFEEMAGG
jgi:hypothetical protein